MKSTKYSKSNSKVYKASFENGSYCHYTDNIHDLPPNATFPNSQIIITLHGWPGDHQEMEGIYQSTLRSTSDSSIDFCRWINFIVPGFDGFSEMGRGVYNGYLNDLSDLIKDFIQSHLKLKQKIISLGYSGGNVWWRFC